LETLVAVQRLEEEAVCYPQIEEWADALVSYAREFGDCVIWPVGASAERIAGVATVRARGQVDVGRWNASVADRTILLFAVAAVSPLSLTLTAEQLRRRHAVDIHACGIAITGAATAEGIKSFKSLGNALAVSAIAA
jgi:hypothetical protein